MLLSSHISIGFFQLINFDAHFLSLLLILEDDLVEHIGLFWHYLNDILIRPHHRFLLFDFFFNFVHPWLLFSSVDSDFFLNHSSIFEEINIFSLNFFYKIVNFNAKEIKLLLKFIYHLLLVLKQGIMLELSAFYFIKFFFNLSFFQRRFCWNFIVIFSLVFYHGVHFLVCYLGFFQ